MYLRSLGKCSKPLKLKRADSYGRHYKLFLEQVE
jgi:hypothetical protein